MADPTDPTPATPLPSADDFFGAAAPTGALPSADTFFGQPSAPDTTALERNRRMRGHVDAPMEGAAADHLFSNGWFKRTADAFTEGFTAAGGTSGIGTLSPETEKTMKDLGLWNDYATGQHSGIKAFNEAILRPVMAPIATALQETWAATVGTAQAVGQFAEEAGSSKLLGMPGSALTRNIMDMAQDVMGRVGLRPEVPNLAKAQELGVIGLGGDDAYFDIAPTVNRTPSGFAEFSRRADELAREAEAPKPGEAPEAPPAAETPTAPAAPTEDPIHARARAADPATMAQFDALQTRQTTYRRWIDQAAEAQRTAAQDGPEATAARDKVATILDKVGGDETRLTKAAAGRLAQARADLETALNPGDTPEMAQIRKALVQADQRMRDLAPAVSEAYRQAREEGESAAPVLSGGPDHSAAGGGPADLQRAASGEQAATPAAEPPRAAESAETPPVPTEQESAAEGPAAPLATPEHRAAIADDVSQKLVAAGRPKDEADAAAALVAEHYATRAERFGGAKGTALEMYQRDAPEIQGAEKGGRGGAAAGKTTFGAHDTFGDGHAVITLFKRADASTFIHEMGHHFFDELLHDAEDASAPAELVADAKAARAWAGIPEDAAIADIKTRPHEKFARGFERYLYDGVAPSPQLARVFAQFRDWLVRAYDAIKGRFKPKEISDDIRDVFDRLIARHPEKQVGAPKPETPTAGAKPFSDLLAGIHETEAKHVPAGEAKDLGDTIEQEITNAGQPTGGGTGGTPGGGGSEAGGGPGAEIPGGGGVGRGAQAAEREPAAVGQGAADGTAEGAGPRPVTGAEPDAPGGPNTAGERSSPYVDKAGNIRLENLNATEDAKAIIRQLALQNSDFMDARFGEPSYQIYQQIRAAGDLLVQAADAAVDAFQKWDKSESDADAVAYYEATQRTLIAAEARAELTASWGRAGHAFRAVDRLRQGEDVTNFIKRNTGKTLYQMREEGKLLSALDTPEQRSSFLSDSRLSRWQKARSWIISYFINNLISGPLTHAAYHVGNDVLALVKAVPETAVTAAIGAVREAIAGEPVDRVYMGEVHARLYGSFTGYANGLVAGRKAFLTGVPYMKGLQDAATDILERGLQGKMVRDTDQGIYFGEQKLGADYTAARKFLANEKNASIADALDKAAADVKRVQQTIPGTLGYIMEAPSRSVQAIHTIGYGMGYESEIAARAYRAATKEGLTGDDFNRRVAEFTQDPPDADVAEAHEEALRMVLMRKPNFDSTQGLLSRAINQNIAAKIIMPFMQIGVNILREGAVERTVLGLASKSVRENLSGLNGAVARDTQLAKMIVGTSLGVAVVGLAANGSISGSGPSDPRERTARMLTGWLPYSLRVGNMWVPYRKYLGPLGPIVGGAANTYEVGHLLSEGDLAKAAGSTMLGMTEVVADETWMRGVTSFVDAARHWDTAGAKYIRQLATDFIPYSIGLGQVAAMTDTSQREVHTMLEAAQNKIPGLRPGLHPMRDVWGEPIAAHTMLSPAEVKNDPVNAEMLNLDVFPDKVKRAIRGVQLSEQQYDDYARIAGRFAKLQLNKLVASPGWRALPGQVRHDTMESVIQGARRYAENVIIGQDMNASLAGQIPKDETILAKAVKAKEAKHQIGAGR